MFCRGQELPIWLDSREECWGGNLMNSILIEHDVLGLKPATIRRKISGIRFFHITRGGSDFAKVGDRWKILLNGLSSQETN